jgi:hypothetical protein
MNRIKVYFPVSLYAYAYMSSLFGLIIALIFLLDHIDNRLTIVYYPFLVCFIAITW